MLAWLPLAFSGAAAEAYMMVVPDDNDGVVCQGSVCIATARMACISADKLEQMLAQGDVTLVPGAVAKDIVVTAPVRWESGHRLIFDSFHSVSIRRPIMISGGGGLTITTNDGGKNGKFAIINQGRIGFTKKNSGLTINGSAYKLVGSVKELAFQVQEQPDGHFALTSDFDAQSDPHKAPAISTVFSGTFDGLGHTISNLAFSHATEVYDGEHSYWAAGLFASIARTGVVRDLALNNVSAVVSHAGAEIGSVAGHNEGLIRYVTASGTVTGKGSAVGGIAGYSSGTLYAVTSTIKVDGTSSKWAGGMVGNNRGVIERSQAAGDVTGGRYSGGLAGFSNTTLISYATGSVTGGADDAIIGGLIGQSREIVESYATGTVTGNAVGVTAGGLAGDAAQVKNSYATGRVEVGPTGIAGGLVGDLPRGKIMESYSIGPVSG
ncbi:MAG: hypothetical protein JOY77_04640, partial [Alphaproteobacteria bacterium]|nr:hypothetical protein [Alphaproteobacteria bacterium]